MLQTIVNQYLTEGNLEIQDLTCPSGNCRACAGLGVILQKRQAASPFLQARSLSEILLLLPQIQHHLFMCQHCHIKYYFTLSFPIAHLNLLTWWV